MWLVVTVVQDMVGPSCPVQLLSAGSVISIEGYGNNNPKAASR